MRGLVSAFTQKLRHRGGDKHITSSGDVSHPMMYGTIASEANTLFERAKKITSKHPILNFMFVGGIGFIVNISIYYPLSLVFENEVTILGQHFYLPPFIISSFIAILCNYEMNKRWTFKRQKTNSYSRGRYMLMALVTLVLDVIMLWLLVDYGHLFPTLGAVIALNAAFLLRYAIARVWVWKKEVAA